MPKFKGATGRVAGLTPQVSALRAHTRKGRRRLTPPRRPPGANSGAAAAATAVGFRAGPHAGASAARDASETAAARDGTGAADAGAAARGARRIRDSVDGRPSHVSGRLRLPEERRRELRAYAPTRRRTRLRRLRSRINPRRRCSGPLRPRQQLPRLRPRSCIAGLPLWAWILIGLGAVGVVGIVIGVVIGRRKAAAAAAVA